MSTDPLKNEGGTTRIGEFELRAEIGRGGMGTVYAAWQRSLSRTVAVKVLDRQVSASSTAVARFLREAQAAAKLHHTHIVPIFAQGEDNGVYYYAMELVDGQSLNAIIAAKKELQAATTSPLDVEATKHVSRSRQSKNPAAETIALPRSPSTDVDEDSSVTLSAASRTVVVIDDFREIARHIADVANALQYAHDQGVIHRDIKPHNLLLGKDGRLRISDFGLARLAEQPGVTMTGELLGSPLYMSPEQILGDSSQVDHRTDIYSLGATLYEWLTLSAPYPAETRERIISLIVSSEPTLPRQLNPRIPLDLETVCLKALELQKDRRYQSAGALRDDLQHFLADRPIRARRASLTLRVSKFVRRHQVASIGGAAIMVASALGLALFTQRGQVQSKTVAMQAAQKAAVEAIDKNERVLDILSALPIELGGTLKVAGAVGDMVGGRGLVESMGQGGAAERASIGTPEAIARRAVKEFYQAIATPDWPPPGSGAHALLRGAIKLWETGDPSGALNLVDNYLKEKADDSRALQLQLALLTELSEFGRMVEAAEAIRPTPGVVDYSRVWRGTAYMFVERFEEGIVELNEAVRQHESSPWPKVLRGFAMIRAARGPGAMLDFEDVLRTHPTMVVAVLGRALANMASAQYDKALPDVESVMALEPSNADVLTIRGDCHVAMGDYESGIRDFQKAIDVSGKRSALGLRYISALVQQQRQAKDKAISPAAQPTADPKDVPSKANEQSTVGSVVDWFSKLLQPAPKGGT